MTLIRDYIDNLRNIFLILGRGANQVALRANGSAAEIRNSTDTAYADLRLRNLQLDGFQPLSRVFGITRRQAISQGPIASSGLPNSITAPGGLTCQINASVTNPIVCNFAAGFDLPSATIPVPLAIDYTGYYTSVQGYSGLTANTTHYFYLERNTSTGALTPARITIAPVYSRVAPSSPSAGQHWFKTSQDSVSSQPGMSMYEWSGSAWVPRQRVFLGEVTTGASSVTNVANYSYDRRYQSPWTAVSAGASANFAHNLGMTAAEAEATLTFYGRQNSGDPNHTIIPPGLYFYADLYGILSFGAGSRINYAALIGSSGIYNIGSWLTSADVMISINSGW